MTRTTLTTVALAAAIAAVAACTACNRPAPITINYPGPATAGSGNPAAPAPSTMSVSGTATLEIVPDTADLHVTLTSEQSRPRAAAAGVRAKQAAFAKALADLGVEADNIALSYLSVNPVYDDKGRLVDYSAAITMTITSHEFDRLPDLMEAATAAGATSTSTDFRVGDLAGLKKKVRAQALAAVKDKAEMLTSSLGAKLGRVRDISENAGGEGAWAWNGGVANSVSYEPRTMTGIKADAQALTLTINVVYELA